MAETISVAQRAISARTHARTHKYTRTHACTHTRTQKHTNARSLGGAHGAQLEHGALQLQIFSLQVAHLRRRQCCLPACCLLHGSMLSAALGAVVRGARGHPMRGHDFGCGILSFALSYDSNRDLPRFLGFFGFRTSVVSSRFIIMRFSSSGADPAVQCSARTSPPNSRLLQ